MMNSASSSEPMMVATTAIGSTRMNLPGGAGQGDQGQEGEDERGGAAEDRHEDLPRAGERRLHARVPMRRWRAMFSTTTMESSTSRPSATTKPAIEIWLSE